MSSATHELTCSELVEIVTDYLEGALDDANRRRVDEHLVGCEDCATYLEQLRVTIKLVGRVTTEHFPPAMEEKLLVAFRDWRRI